jgi:hypothetical protein
MTSSHLYITIAGGVIQDERNSLLVGQNIIQPRQESFHSACSVWICRIREHRAAVTYLSLYIS